MRNSRKIFHSSARGHNPVPNPLRRAVEGQMAENPKDNFGIVDFAGREFSWLILTRHFKGAQLERVLANEGMQFIDRSDLVIRLDEKI